MYTIYPEFIDLFLGEMPFKLWKSPLSRQGQKPANPATSTCSASSPCTCTWRRAGAGFRSSDSESESESDSEKTTMDRRLRPRPLSSTDWAASNLLPVSTESFGQEAFHWKVLITFNSASCSRAAHSLLSTVSSHCCFNI